MTSDARINVGLPHHPKTKKLIRRIGEGGAWNLVCLFLWVAQNRPTGILMGLSDEDIEIAALYDREPGKLIATLCDVGFMDGPEGSRSIHDWAEHNPWAAGAERRSESARNAALAKHHGCDADAARMRPAENRNAEVCDEHAAGRNPLCPVSVSVSKTTSSRQRASRLPENWALPPDWSEDAKDIFKTFGTELSVDIEAAKFADYWHGKGGREATKLDWRGTWRNWIRNACQRSFGSFSGKPAPLPMKAIPAGKYS